MKPAIVDFSGIRGPRDLALAIGCSQRLIEKTIELNDTGPSLPRTVGDVVLLERPGAYSQIAIPKKSRFREGESRSVWVIHDVELANAQKALLRRLYGYLERRSSAFPSQVMQGYIPGRSTVSNAAVHVGNRLLLKADIADFFGSISLDMVKGALFVAGLPEPGATLVARFTTIRGRLPLGFNASPLLANLVCIPLDSRFDALAKKLACSYTRYADDLSFSGNVVLPQRGDVEQALAAEGFRLCEWKFRASKRGQRQTVTGLSISDGVVPRLPKAFKRLLRQELYYCEKFGLGEHAEAAGVDDSVQSAINRLDGRIAYARGVEPRFGDQVVPRWRDLLRRSSHQAIRPMRPGRAPHKVAMVFDESIFRFADSQVFAMCCVTLDDPEGTRSQLTALLEAFVADPFVTGRNKRLRNSGFHYADDSEEIRTDVIKLFSILPLRAFVIFCKMADDCVYEDLYARQFRGLLVHRLQSASGRRVDLICEENPQVALSRLRRELIEMYEDLGARSAARPLEVPSLDCRGKVAEPLLALPDYFLGVFRGFAVSGGDVGKHDTALKRFERLRDRIRLVVNLDSGQRYSRHRPFAPLLPG